MTTEFSFGKAIYKGVKTGLATLVAVWAALQAADVDAALQALSASVPAAEPDTWVWLLPVAFGLVRLIMNVLKHMPMAWLDNVKAVLVLAGTVASLTALPFVLGGCALFGPTPYVEETITMPDGTVKEIKQVDQEALAYQREMQGLLLREGIDLGKVYAAHRLALEEAESAQEEEDQLIRWVELVEALGRARAAWQATGDVDAGAVQAAANRLEENAPVLPSESK